MAPRSQTANARKSFDGGQSIAFLVTLRVKTRWPDSISHSKTQEWFRKSRGSAVRATSLSGPPHVFRVTAAASKTVEALHVVHLCGQTRAKHLFQRHRVAFEKSPIFVLQKPAALAPVINSLTICQKCDAYQPNKAVAARFSVVRSAERSIQSDLPVSWI